MINYLKKKCETKAVVWFHPSIQFTFIRIYTKGWGGKKWCNKRIIFSFYFFPLLNLSFSILNNMMRWFFVFPIFHINFHPFFSFKFKFLVYIHPMVLLHSLYVLSFPYIIMFLLFFISI